MSEEMESKVAEAFAAEVTQEDLNNWYLLQAELERVKGAELQLRNKIFAGKFTAPIEGVNSVPLADGYVLKGTYKVNRTLDLPVFTTQKADLLAKGLPLDDLVKWKPEVSVTAYKKLSEEQRKEFDAVITIKPGTPSLEIVLPKRV